jgi:alpha-galactosidase
VEVLRPTGGALLLRSPQAEFSVHRSGYISAAVRDAAGGAAGLDDPPEGWSYDTIEVDGAQPAFIMDLDGTDDEVLPGRTGRRLTLTGDSPTVPLRKHVVLEVRVHVPALALITISYENRGKRPIVIERQRFQRHRLVPGLVSFQSAGLSRPTEILPLSPGLSRRLLLGTPFRLDRGGGLPVLAFWNAQAGLAVGSLNRDLRLLSAQVAVAADGRAEVGLEVAPRRPVMPGSTVMFPQSFVMAFRGDFQVPLTHFARGLFGRLPPVPAHADEVRWVSLDCGPCNGLLTSPAQPLPGALKAQVAALRGRGYLVRLRWRPLYVAPRSPLALRHPDWLLSNAAGRPIAGPELPLCPLHAEVTRHHQLLVRRLLSELAPDGLAVEDVYTLPWCLNPDHGHSLPGELVLHLPAFYQVLFAAARAARPAALLQIDPAGGPANYRLLPLADQAVVPPATGRPLRRLLKQYRALLTRAPQVAGPALASDQDLAAVVGLGAVPGLGPDDASALATKWRPIFLAERTSRGTLLPLYADGLDRPEGYALEREGHLYYAFFTEPGSARYQGAVELRGLKPGRHRVHDYEHQRDLGQVEAAGGGTPRLQVDFAGHLLLRASPIRQ